MSSQQQLLLQAGISILVCLAFYLVGSLLCRVFNFSDDRQNSAYSNTFYRLLTGMIFTVTMYALVGSSFKTVHVFMLFAAGICLKIKRPLQAKRPTAASVLYRTVELLVMVAFFVIVFNYLPESEFKQEDSFYYLKISEALNFSGQENTNNYYNLWSPEYRGVEMYHYFDCWLAAMLMKFTNGLLPGIQVFRIVTYAVISVIFLYGLFYTYEWVTGKRAGIGAKLLSIAFLFFLPDIFDYVPGGVKHYLVFNFENNFLERPNFRLIYLFLIPVLAAARKSSSSGRLMFFLICLCIMNPTIMMAVVPGIILMVILRRFLPGAQIFPMIPLKQLLVFLGFVALYTGFYFYYSSKSVPPMYDFTWEAVLKYYQHSYHFVLLTILTSLLYISILIAVFYYSTKRFFPLRFNDFFRRNRTSIFLSAILIFSGIIVARMGGFMENLYQVAYNSYVIASLLIFMVLAVIADKSFFHVFSLVVLCTCGYVAYKVRHRETLTVDIFSQNGGYCYSGKKYSDKYLQQVKKFAAREKEILGGFITDSAYYRGFYYSSHNPNIYHLPVTYIMANHAKVNDICMTPSEVITYDNTGQIGDNFYLTNAVERSYFHRWRAKNIRPDHTEANTLRDFIILHKFDYVVLTPDVRIDSIPGLPVKTVFRDENTGERFWVLDDIE